MFCSNAQKEKSHQLRTLEAKFKRLDTALQCNFSEQVALERSLVRKEINNILKRKSEFQIHRTRQRYYFQGARPSHLLAMRIRTCDHFSDIPAIQIADGSVSTDPKEINNTFKDFFSELYRSEVILDKDQCDDWLTELNLPKLSREDSAGLDKAITLEELRIAMQSMQRGKSPGIDGIPPEFYIVFWDRVLTFLI